MLPDIMPSMNIDKVIGELHKFFRAFPSHSWKKRTSDTPLRTIKTILHTMAKIQGEEVGLTEIVNFSSNSPKSVLSSILKLQGKK